jgi:hypothetical protein
LRFQRVGSLEIDEDLDLERREWIVQRAGWIVVLLLLIAGLAGLLGPGPLSHVEASSGPLTVTYERFVHKRAPTELQVQLEPGAADDGEVAIWFDRAYLSKVAIDHVLPEPAETIVAADGVIYRFAVEDPEQVSEIVFDVAPAEPGIARGQIGLVESPGVAIAQFIYP